MKFFVSRQCEYPDGDYVVEIAQGGLDYANPGMLTPKWAELGEGKEFDDPREAVEAAIKIRDEWNLSRFFPDVLRAAVHGAEISFGCTMGFTLPLERMSDEQLHQKAEKIYDGLPKCAECNNLLGKETYTHDYADEDKFCREYCAEKNYNNYLEQMLPDDEEKSDDPDMTLSMDFTRNEPPEES